MWRPVSNDAIRKMWLGEGVGKSLNIKGKSAKTGELSGFVPFIQISDPDQVGAVSDVSPPGARTRIFFASEEARDLASNPNPTNNPNPCWAPH